MTRLPLVLAALLATTPLSAQTNNGPRMGLDGSIHSPSSSYGINGSTGAATFGALTATSNLSVGGNAASAGGTWSVNGFTGAITAPNVSVSPVQYLAAGQTTAQLLSGLIDATPVIARTVAGGNKSVVMPCGTYRFDEPLTNIVSFTRVTGGQYGCVTVQQTFAVGSAFNINSSGGAYVEGVTIDHIKVVMAPGVVKTAGASFHAEQGHNIHFEYDRSDGDYVGFDLRSGPNQFGYFVSDNEVNGATNNAFFLGDMGDPTHQVEAVYMRSNLIGGSAIAYYIQNASGVYIDQGDACCNGGGGVKVAPLAGQNVNALYISKVLADQNTGPDGGFSFPNSGGAVTEVYLTDDWGAGSTTGSGISIANPKLDGLTIKSFKAHSNYKAGIDIEAGTNITVESSMTCYNDTSKIGLPGILLGGSTSHVILSNNVSGKCGYIVQAAPSQANYQNYGIVIGGAAAYVDAHDNQTFNNATGGLLDNSSNSSTNIHNNNLSQ